MDVQVHSMFLLILLFCFYPTIRSADGLSADIVFELLSRRFDFVIQEIDAVKSDVEEIKKNLNNLDDLKHKIETLEAKTVTDVEETNEKDTRDNFRRYSNALRRMFTTEKKVIREHFERFDDRFGEFQTNVLSKLSITNMSTESAIENLFQDLSDHKTETNVILHEVRNETIARFEDITHAMQVKELETNTTIIEVRTNSEMNLRAMENNVNHKLISEVARVTRRLAEVTREQDQHKYEIEQQQDEIDDLESRISSEESYTSGLSRRISAEEERKVAFSAILNTKQSYYSKNEKIVFNDVKYSHGGGYDSSTGVFTAPKSGTYLFTFNIESTSDGMAHASLKVRGYVKASAVVEEGTHYNGGNACVAYLSEDDRAWVETASLSDRYYVFPYRTTFNGVLID